MTETNLVNLTPHAIKIAGEDNQIVREVPPSGEQARVAASTEVVGAIDGVDVVKTTFGAISGLPEPQEGTIYVVSLLVAQASRRNDVVSPDTGPTAVRDENGRIVACKRFQRF